MIRSGSLGTMMMALLMGGCAQMQQLAGPAGDPRIDQAPMNADSKRQARDYFSKPNPKAFAFAPGPGTNWHAWGYASTEEARQVSVSKCEELTGQRCALFALNDEIVWRPDSQPDDQAMAPAPMDRAQLQALRDAADGGSAKAQLDLGNYYLHGIGVERDPVEARGWFMKAAEQGDGLAAYELGLIYEKGLGVERSRQEAGRWFAAGAKAGNPASVQKAKEYGVAG